MFDVVVSNLVLASLEIRVCTEANIISNKNKRNYYE